MIYRSFSSAYTKNFASRLARRVTSAPRGKSASVLALHGELGAGKTTFVQGFLRALGVRQRITSPTFLIVHRYALAKRKSLNAKHGFTAAYHIDGYRLKRASELSSLGLKEIFGNPSHIVLVEWPQRLKRQLPRRAVRVEFHHGARESERRIIIKGKLNGRS